MIFPRRSIIVLLTLIMFYVLGTAKKSAAELLRRDQILKIQEEATKKVEEEKKKTFEPLQKIRIFKIIGNIEYQENGRIWQHVERYIDTQTNGLIRVERSLNSNKSQHISQAVIRVVCLPSSDKEQPEELEVSFNNLEVKEVKELKNICISKSSSYAEYIRSPYRTKVLPPDQRKHTLEKEVEDVLDKMWIGGINPSIPYIVSPRYYFTSTGRPMIRWNPVPCATYYIVTLEQVDAIVTREQVDPYRAKIVWKEDHQSTFTSDSDECECKSLIQDPSIDSKVDTQVRLEKLDYPVKRPPLTSNTAYRFRVEAFDKKGNKLSSSLDEEKEVFSTKFKPPKSSYINLGIQGLAFRYRDKKNDSYQQYIENKITLEITTDPSSDSILSLLDHFSTETFYGECIELLLTTINAKSKDPLIPLIYLELGKIYMKNGLITLAAKNFRKVIEFIPDGGEDLIFLIAKASSEQYLGELYIATNLENPFVGIKFLNDSIQSYETASKKIPKTNIERSRLQNVANNLREHIQELSSL